MTNKKRTMKNVIIYAALFILMACNEKPKSTGLSTDLINNPASADGDKNEKMPVLQFEETRHHFGDAQEGDKLTYSFKFTNAGKADLLIGAVSPSCGCTVASYPKEPIKPGEDGEISITFNTAGRSGMQSKTISVLSNSIPSTRVLTISAEVHL